jgi:hypothetical protein
MDDRGVMQSGELQGMGRRLVIEEVLGNARATQID